jgi:sulfoxide reductase heme-binding subunit YedZ
MPVRFRGWPLVIWVAVVVGAGVGAILLVQGTGPEGIGAWLRWTARVSGLLFYAAISASALRVFWDAPGTRALLENRRYVGVSAAVAHTWHLAGIVAYANLPDAQVQAGSAVPGGLAYLFLFAMAGTSFDRSAAWLGARRWKLLHTVGAWYVWLVFTYTFLGSAGTHLLSGVLAVLGIGVLGLRVALAVRRPRANGATT